MRLLNYWIKMSSLLTYWKVSLMMGRYLEGLKIILIICKMRFKSRFKILKMDRLVCGLLTSLLKGFFWWKMLWLNMKIIIIRICRLIKIHFKISPNLFCLASVYIPWKGWLIWWIIRKTYLLLVLVAKLWVGCIWI